MKQTICCPSCKSHFHYVPDDNDLIRCDCGTVFSKTLAAQLEPRKGEYLIPAGARDGACRSCGADVLWITTAKGSAMPLSAATIEERDGDRYALSHFADCPQGKGWGKKSR
jgi:hypothetical protein